MIHSKVVFFQVLGANTDLTRTVPINWLTKPEMSGATSPGPWIVPDKLVGFKNQSNYKMGHLESYSKVFITPQQGLAIRPLILCWIKMEIYRGSSYLALESTASFPNMLLLVSFMYKSIKHDK